VGVDDVLARAEAMQWWVPDPDITGEQIPRRLRALVRADASEAEEVWLGLLFQAFHQGSRTEAAVPLIGVVADLLAEPACPNREWFVRTFTSLGAGYEEEAILSLLTEPGDTPYCWSYPEGAATRDALADRVDVLYPLCGDPDPRVRQLAVRGTVLCPEKAAVSRSTVSASVDAEADQPTLASGLVWLAALDFLCGDALNLDRLERAVNSSTDQVHLCGLVGLSILGQATDGQRAELRSRVSAAHLFDGDWIALAFEDDGVATIDHLARRLVGAEPSPNP
jgi:hypothetical protein